jgi:hypothetical protein
MIVAINIGDVPKKKIVVTPKELPYPSAPTPAPAPQQEPVPA